MIHRGPTPLHLIYVLYVHFKTIKGENETKQLKEVIQRWLQFSDTCNAQMTMASATNKFWNESHAKLIVCNL